MSSFLLASVALLFVVGATPARAQGWSAGLDVPVQFVFTGDFSGMTMPSGFKLTLDTPWNVGIGYESYSVDLEDTASGISTSAEYTMMDIFAEAYFRVIHVAVGYGTGSVDVEPFTSFGAPFVGQDGDADQNYLQLGWPVDANWAFHVAHHRVDATVPLLLNNVPTAEKLDLGGVMHSVGAKYMF